MLILLFNLRGHSKGKKGNVALSALTLLAFLFFLHILQNCIQEHMQEMKGKYKGNNNGNTTINLPNVIVIDSSSNSNGRNNPKGDDGLLPLSEEDLGQWPIKTHMAQKEAQNRVYKPRAKKTNQKKQQKENKQQQAQHRNAPTPGKNTIQGLAYPIDAADVNIPMHRIDNIP